MSKHRIFIAIDIPDELKKLSETLLKDFQTNVPIKKTKEEDVHITIVFCGDLNDKELEEVEKTAEETANRTKKFQLTPKGIVFAPPHRKTKRMVWLTFKDSPEFSALSEKFSSFADKKMKGVFPHATLVRFNSLHYQNLKKLIPEEGISLESEARPFSVERINIMESILSKEGPRYKVLKTFKLV